MFSSHRPFETKQGSKLIKSNQNHDMSSRILVYGGGGTLGRSILQKFSSKGWITYCADIVKYTDSSVSYSFGVNAENDSPQAIKQNVESVCQWLDSTLENQKLNCIVNAAGGFMMDDITSDNFYDQLDTMWKWNSLTAFQCGSIASRYLLSNSSALLVLTGAAPAFGATPIMLSYGTSKVVVHHLVKTLAVTETMPKDSKTIGIVPVTIDTPPNRQAMSDADFTNWTKPEEFAEQIFKWADGQDMVTNGGLYQFDTKKGQTTVTMH